MPEILHMNINTLNIKSTLSHIFKQLYTLCKKQLKDVWVHNILSNICVRRDAETAKPNSVSSKRPLIKILLENVHCWIFLLLLLLVDFHKVHYIHYHKHPLYKLRNQKKSMHYNIFLSKNIYYMQMITEKYR